MSKGIGDFFDEIFIWIPSIVMFFIFLYNVINRGEIIMKDWITILGAVLAGVIAAVVAIWKENRNSTKIIEKVEARHTLEKAHEYHELTMKELEKEFQYNKERITDVKGGISAISSAVGGVSRDIKLMSKDLENHVLNLKEVVYKEPDLVEALKIFEGYIQKLGEVQIENERLHKKNQELLIELEHQNEKNKELTLQINTFHQKICDIEKEAQLLKADKSQQNEYIELLRQENQKLKRLKKKDHSKDDLSL